MIRRFAAGDVARTQAVLEAAYGTSSFGERLHRYAGAARKPGWVAVERDAIAGCVFLADYGEGSYLGLMAVAPPRQRHGIARALLDAALREADARGIGWIRLDATPAGAPLYRGAGFADAGETVVFEGVAAPPGRFEGVRAATAADGDAIVGADRAAFGADRREVLDALLADPACATVVGPRGGYAIARTARIGPVVAADAAEARALFAVAATLRDGAPLRFDVPPGNAAALALARDAGLRESRRLAHMIRGAAPGGDAARLFARATLGEG